MPLFQVTRPSILMITELVEANDEHYARIAIEKGEGRLLIERQDEPSKDHQNMQVSEYKDQPESDGPVFFVEREERHKQLVRVRAKDEKDARHRVKEGEGSEIGHSEYVDTMNLNYWNVERATREE